MFSNVLRSQARLGLAVATRTVVLPASRSLSSLVLRQAVAPTVPRLAVARAFSSGSVLAFDGRKMQPTTTLYVGNMPWDMTTQDLTDLFSEFGTVTSVRVQTGADGRPRGFGHVTFETIEDATAAMSSAAEEPIHVAGRDLKIDFARERTSVSPSENEPSKKLYFARFNGGEMALRAILDEHKSDLVSIYFIRDGNTGEKRNAGFIEFDNVATATKVLETLNGFQTEDGVLSLSYARPRRPDDKYNQGDRRYPRRDYNNNNRSNGYQSRREY